MEAQVLKSLGKLKKLLPRNQKELKDVIDASTVAMTTALDRKTKSSDGGGGVGTMTQVPFEPFLLAVLTRQAKLVAIALDCIEKFLAFGFLQGNGQIPESIRKRLIQKYGKTPSSSTPNPPTSPTTPSSSADDSLSLNEENWKLIDCIIEVICDANDHPDETVQIQVLRVLLTAVTTPTCEVHEHSLLKAVRACYHIHLVSKTHTNQTVAKATLQQIISIVFQRMETFDQRVREETEAVLKTSRVIVASPTASWYPDVTRVLEFQKPVPAAPLFAPSFPSVLHKDAFLLFRSLCRISMRSIAEDASLTPTSPTSSPPLPPPPVDDPFAFQSKLLSLELVLSILTHSGPSFRQGERFIHAIRQYLCQSLLQNCTSNYLQIVDVSLQLFMVLLQQFKQYLKSEVEIFMTSVFLRLLQSEHATLEHKVLVIKVLHEICQDATLLGEIFLNYDCDWHTTDLFKQMMDVVAKMAKGKGKTKANEVLVVKGLECLTAAVQSLQQAAHLMDQKKEIKEEVDDLMLPPPPPPPPPPSSSAVEAFDRKKRRQEEVATGILQFNVKPSTGIQYLIQHGHLNQGTPRDVAMFLHEHANRLDKTQVGDYLGKEIQYQSGFCVKTLHEYVDLIDFSGLEIDVAIRLFLSGFRLPGESQKIDRMMEKFAQRYYSTCPIGLFPSADTAFILSFSIIMLQTDLHNPNVAEEKKMTKDGFIRNNRGINNGEDLPESYLGGIYDRIKQNPISLKEDLELKARTMGTNGTGNTPSGGLFGPSSAVMDRQRRDAYSKERESMVRASEALFKRRTPGSTHRKDPNPKESSTTVFYLLSGTERSHIKPMFETIWAPLLACCSVLFEAQDSMTTIGLCLQAFQSAIHLSARLEMNDERDAFVSVLSKFTALHTTGSRLLKHKHMEAIKTLLLIAVQEGNYLGDAWREVLQCLSQLARLQTHAQGLEGDFTTSKRTSLTSSSSTSSLQSSTTTSSIRRGFMTSTSPIHRETPSSSSEEELYNQAIQDENATRILVEIESLAMDRVFSSSVSLSDQAIQEFVVQLCVVSLSECSGVLNPHSTTPRVFSLQKLVEVADMNMLIRSRMVWSTTWKVLSRHFTTIGCHEHHEIAMYAIDSLRQLSMRFLEKAELKDFNFQRLFLTPFEIIISNALSVDIKELVLRCIENIILARVQTIKSGWKTIWGVLRVAAETYEQGHEEASSGSDRIVQLGFQITTRLLESHFERMLDVFVDAVECLVAFAVCGSDKRSDPVLIQMSLSSIELLTRICLTKMATGQVIEKIFVESMGAKRIGFTKRKGGEPSKARYEKQESLRTLEEEIVAMSPPSTPSHIHRRSTVTSTLSSTNEAIYTDCAAHTRIWWPVLTALSTLAADRRVDVRLSALHSLCSSLETHGDKLSSGLWSLIFKGVLIPLLDELRHVEIHIETQRPIPTLPDRWTSYQRTTATSTQCLEWILNLYGIYYDQVGFLPEILFLLGKCMDSQDAEEELATAAVRALEEMLKNHGHKFPEDVWGLIADELRSVMTRAEPTWVFFRIPTTTPSNLLSPRVPSLIAMYPTVPRALGIQFASTFPPKMVSEDEIRAQERPCQTHLVVILALQQLIATVLTSRETRQLSLSEGHATSLLGCLRESFRFARKLNDALPVRQHLAAHGWTYGRVSSTDVPNVLWQEVGGKETYGRVLFHGLQMETVDRWKREESRRQMQSLVQSTFEEYLRWTVPSYEKLKEDVDISQRVVRYTPLMVSLLTQLAQLSCQEMQRHLQWVYPLLNDLIKTKNEDVRIALTQVYSQCIGQLLPLTVPTSPPPRPMSSHGRPPSSFV